MKPIFAIDPSLTRSGFCYEKENKLIYGTVPAKNYKKIQRLHYLQRMFSNLMDEAYQNPFILTVEHYSYGAKSRALYEIGEFSGVLKLLAYQKNCDILIVPPTSLKLFVAGKGNADKNLVQTKVKDRWNLDTKYDDEADAIGLYYLTRAYLNRRLCRSGSSRQAVSGCVFYPRFP